LGKWRLKEKGAGDWGGYRIFVFTASRPNTPPCIRQDNQAFYSQASWNRLEIKPVVAEIKTELF
jgi:hypothetical protein